MTTTIKTDGKKKLSIILVWVGLLAFLSFFDSCKSITKSKVNVLDSIVVIKNSGTVQEDRYEKGRMYVAVEGEVFNKSSVYSYKDFIVEINFLSYTNTLISTRKDTLYTSISPLQKKELNERIEEDFPIKYKNYKLEWKLLDAVQYIPESK